MSVDELKRTILDKVENLSEEQLKEVKQFIDSMNTTVKEYDLLPHVGNIMFEREEVLKKLAQ